MNIGFDLDEVLADLLSSLIKFHNTNYKTNLVKEHFVSNKFWEVWGGTKDEATQKVYNFHASDYLRNLKPIDGSKEIVDFLKKKNNLFVITSRSNDFESATVEWINQHFPKKFSSINFANHYSQSGKQITKSSICNDLGIDIMIEDSVDHALDCLSPTRKILLVDHPWNKSFNPIRGIYRIKSLKEIADFV